MVSYDSPRWSGEVLDCSMPMTFDQYNQCSFDCLYCFSFAGRALWLRGIEEEEERAEASIYNKPVITVNPQRVKDLFSGALKNEFSDYVGERLTVQWGGLSDPFDMNEKKHGVGLEILRHLHSLEYPVCFSTKGTWWLKDRRYMDLFTGNTFWNVKFSIINMDAERAKKMERGVPSPEKRLDAIAELAEEMGPDGGGVTLRLRPFIIGYSNIDGEHLELIRRAAAAGATAVSTEFYCAESRTTPESRERLDVMSEIVGFDLLDFYRSNTNSPTGYLRLNWKIKKPYVDEMEAECKRLGLRFYVSDAHHKDRCGNGSCCGLQSDRSYHRGQFTEALVIAKAKGTVEWEDIEAGMLPCFSKIGVVQARGVNIARGTPRDRARFRDFSIKDYMKFVWNSPNLPRSPYRYFYGLLQPAGKNNAGNIIYKYQPYSEKGTK